MINIKKVRPMFSNIVTTMDKYEDDVMLGALIDTSKQKGTLKENQTVVAVGPFVKSINVGDLVNINPKRYMVMKHKEGSLKDGIIGDNQVVSYKFETIEIEGKPHLLLSDSDINYVIEEYDETPDVKPVIQTPENTRLIV